MIKIKNNIDMEFKGTKDLKVETYKRGNTLDFNVFKIEGRAKEHDANLRLLRKAPEMLEMLQIVCTELYKTDNELATKVKQLIKEATEL